MADDFPFLLAQIDSGAPPMKVKKRSSQIEKTRKESKARVLLFPLKAYKIMIRYGATMT